MHVLFLSICSGNTSYCSVGKGKYDFRNGTTHIHKRKRRRSYEICLPLFYRGNQKCAVFLNTKIQKFVIRGIYIYIAWIKIFFFKYILIKKLGGRLNFSLFLSIKALVFIYITKNCVLPIKLFKSTSETGTFFQQNFLIIGMPVYILWLALNLETTS